MKNMKKKTIPLFLAVFTVFPLNKLFSQENKQILKEYISVNKNKDFKKSDLSNFIIDNEDSSKSLNGTVVKFQQTYLGLPIFNAGGTALVQNNKIVYYIDDFVTDYKNTVNRRASLSSEQAVSNISNDLNNSEILNLPIIAFSENSVNKKIAIKQRLLYVKDKNDNLRLSYDIYFREPNSSNEWSYLVDAVNGEIVNKENLTLSCSFHEGAYSRENHLNEVAYLPLNREDHFTVSKNNLVLLSPDNASYNVFALPLEGATFGTRTAVTNPWILSSSPEGWHSNGTTHYTNTRGNNVYAYEDTAAQNLPGLSPDGGNSRNFNFQFNINGTPAFNQNAAITNLFYMNNMVHDIFYKFGFTESARNFQSNNFGNSGVNDDEVMAEAQDGGGTNNANFSSPRDGYNPTMQMYLWSTKNRTFFYNAPSEAITRQPSSATASFGTALTATGVTGNIQLSSVLDGCTALPTGSLSGKIGLVERGTCSFIIKVKNAQNAGATAVVIYNNTANGDTVNGMSGTDSTITIPSVLIGNTEGEFIKRQLAASTVVNVTLKNDPATAITPDGSFDNGIITHEYGHGISNRLTGTGYNCLNSTQDKEQMGEGWSDFFALMLTNKPGDNASVPRGIGTYAQGQPITGAGIRPAKYSPDFTINDYTYADTNGMEYISGTNIYPDVHSIGFVWATMLWDLHWKYVEKYGYSSDVTSNTTNGSSRVLQLVTDALKLQACNPTFIDGRNAILAADLAKTGGADKCMIWNTFARRGLGVNASAGTKTDINDQVEDFTVPADCILGTNEVNDIKNNKISIYPNPAKDEFYISFPNKILGTVNVDVYDMSGKLIVSENKVLPNSKKSFSTTNIPNGVYVVKVNGLGIDLSTKLIIKK